MTRIQIYDTTLRDGAQGEGVNFSLEDKVLIAQRLDDLGFDFVEGGYPLSNPKDAEFFQRIAAKPLKHGRVCAFGMTRRKGMKPADDIGMKSLLESQAPVITIVGKTSDFHATEVLGVSLEENLAMIRENVAYLCEQGREVVYDAEHFFDGWKANPEYAAKTIRAAAEAGASIIVMCDTNGGTMPEEIAAITREAGSKIDKPLGIHTHNDCDLAVANSLAAIDAGAVHVQGTINGLGERCGNADLISVVANLGSQEKGLRSSRWPRRGTPHRAIALRLRNCQHALSRQSAICRPQRLRPQGRHACARRGQGRLQLRAHRSRQGRQRAPRARERTLRPVEYHRPGN